MGGPMRLPEPRGPLTSALCTDLTSGTLAPATVELAERTASAATDPLADEDLQLALAVCYELHYRGFDDVGEDWEWDPDLLRLRAPLERAHTAALRALVGEPEVTDEPVDQQLTALIAADDGPSLSTYMSRSGSLEQWHEYLTLRSVYHLKEADPHTFAVPRLSGRAKAAMVEIQADEYGGGSAERMHSQLFAGMMCDLGLDAGYGALWDDAPPAVMRRGCAGWASTGRRPCSTTSTSRPTPSTSRSPRWTCAARWWPTSPRSSPTSSSGRRARWRWTAWRPATCSAPGRPAGRPCAGSARWRRDPAFRVDSPVRLPMTEPEPGEDADEDPQQPRAPGRRTDGAAAPGQRGPRARARGARRRRDRRGRRPPARRAGPRRGAGAALRRGLAGRALRRVPPRQRVRPAGREAAPRSAARGD